MTNCTYDESMAVQRYYDGELPASEAEAFEAHLVSCTACQAALDSFRDTTAALRSIATADPPQELAARFARSLRERQLQSSRRVAWSLLAAASLLLVSSLFLVGYTQAGEGDSPAFVAQWEEYVVAPPAVDEEYTDLESRTLVAIHIQEASARESGND